MGPTLDHLRHASAPEAGAYFFETDPVEIVDAVRAATDEELLEPIGREDIRPLVVEGIVSRMHEYVVPERLAETEGVVRFDLERRGVLLERHALAFDRGVLKHLPDLREDEPVDVVLRTSVLRFVRLATGHLGAVTGVLRGQLRVRGDKAKALAHSSVIDFPQAR